MKTRSVILLVCFALCVTVDVAVARDASTDSVLAAHQAAKKLEQLGLIKGHVITSEDILKQVEANNVEAVKLFLGAGVNPNFKDRLGRCPLIVAASEGYTDMVKALLDAGADVSVKDRFGRTPLVVAASNEQDVVFEMLVVRSAK